MITPVLLVPTIAGVASFAIRSKALSRFLLLLVAITHTCLLIPYWINGLPAQNNDWLRLDALGLLILSIVSVLFLAASFCVSKYLKNQNTENAHTSETTFTSCLILFLATMTFVCLCQNFGLLWIAIEATTLASAPLIFFHRTNRSLEATWKYLLICSVGIALALVGNLFITISAESSGEVSLLVSDLIANASSLNPKWLTAAFIFLLIGYGTKMGLAPMHTWLPDAHSEAPSLVSALLSGALLNCAFIGILRAFSVCSAAGIAQTAQDLLLVLGILSLIIAAIFILGQTDYKRMLAYSSVEHIGLIAIGIGLGKTATFGSIYHALNHSLTKGMLFLLAGNILAYWNTKKAADVSALLRIQKGTGILWIIGFFAITGLPPFGIFFSEWIILREAFMQEQYFVVAICLFAISVVFFGMASIMLRMAQGLTPSNLDSCNKNAQCSILPPLALGVLALIVGLYLPPQLKEIIDSVVIIINGGAS